jgi:hypothetical protein
MMEDGISHEARIIYEVLTESHQPITEETVEALRGSLGLSSGTEQLLARLEGFLRGLPIEDEFIALATWMEKCKLIHKLDQSQYPSDSSDVYQVPDLFAVFDFNGEDVPVLIEVKASEQGTIETARLSFSSRLHSKLASYARAADLPLLIAWKLFGHWSLFDFSEVQVCETAYDINFASAWSADLMYLLLGNVSVTPMSGVSFTLTYEDLGPTDREVSDGQEYEFRFNSLRVADASGKQLSEMNTVEFILFAIADKNEHQERHDGMLDISFQVVEEPSTIPAYALLPLTLFMMRQESKRPTSWHEVNSNAAYGNITYSQYIESFERSIGTYVRYITKMVPHRKPDFLP